MKGHERQVGVGRFICGQPTSDNTAWKKTWTMLSTVTWSESGVVGIGERVAYYKADERVDALTSVTEGPCGYPLSYRTFTSGLRETPFTSLFPK